MITITLNEKEIKIPAGENLFSFLQANKPGTKNLIVDLNGRILTEKDPLETIKLNDGDIINLFSMVGGG